MGGRTSTASKNKHLKSHYDRPPSFVMPKGRRGLIQRYADMEGISVGRWMNAAIEEKMARFDAEHPDKIMDMDTDSGA